MSRAFLRTIAMLMAIGLITAACGGGEAAPTLVPTSTPAPEPGATHIAPDAYAITMEPMGHWHVNKSKTLLFTVTDTGTGQPASAKDLVIQITRAGSTRVSERSVEEGQVIDKGDGIYSLEYTPSSLAPYAFNARFQEEGQVFASQAWVAEIAKDGEEGIRVDIGGTSYVYQIRYYWDPGHIHASDEDKVTLSFEIMRGIQEGGDINWEQPWRNTFDHITDADHPEVLISSEDGTISEDVHPVYRGKGIYNAERIFSEAEVGHDGRDYVVTFRFTDLYNGAEVSNEAPYLLHAVAPH